MKKILVIGSELLPMPPVEGGAVQNLTQTYIENDLNNKFVVYSRYPKNIDNIKEYKNIEYRYINVKTKKYKIMSKLRGIFNRLSGYKIGNYYIHNIKKQIKNEKYDLIIVENLPYYVLPFRKIYKNKIILHVHNDWLSKNIKNAKLIKNSCKNIYVVSDYVKNRVVEIDNDDSNVKLLMNGIDEKRFSKKLSIKEEKEIKEKYQIKDNDLVFLYTGKLNEKKGADLLISSFIKFSEDKNDVKLLLVGSSFNLTEEDSELIINLKHQAKNNKNIIFTGFVNYDDIHKLYQIADIQIVPSQIEDSCPLVVLEGLAAGNAMIVSDSGGIPELVNEKCAIIIKRNNEFYNNLILTYQKLYNNRDAINKMKEESKKYSTNFTNKKYIDKFIELIGSE